jgi:8-oxo-dGTP pyrophosphatase MutT (NUDIX family)
MSAEPKPSATVVLIRDGDEQLELLLLERNTAREQKRGPWVFPGGKIEPADRVGGRLRRRRGSSWTSRS